MIESDALPAEGTDPWDDEFRTAWDAMRQNARGRWPVVTIVTDGGAPIVDTENYVDGDYTITTPGEGIVHEGGLRIRGRGNSTWGAPKKPYRLNFDVATAPLGMTASQRNWALLANYYDPGKVGNAFALELGALSPSLTWTPEYRIVEVVLNGDFIGLYQLADLVRMEEGRLDLEVADADSGAGLTGAYLLEISNKEAGLEGDGVRTSYVGQLVTVAGPPAGQLQLKNGRWWGGGGAGGTYELVEDAVDGPFDWVTTYIRKEWTTGSDGNGDTGFNTGYGGGDGFAVAPGDVITVSAYLRPSAAKWANMTVRLNNAAWENVVHSGGPDVMLPANEWTRLSRTYTVPTDLGQTVWMEVFPDISGITDGTVLNWTSGATLDGALLQVERIASVGTPFNGDRPDGGGVLYEWAEDLSYSTATNVAGWSTSHDQWILYDTPEAPTDAQKAYIEDYINDFETALFGPTFTDPVTGWRAYADQASFIDWWLINELTRNTDSWNFFSSCKLWKGRSGKLHMGPLWDFDLSLSVQWDDDAPTSPEGWYTRESVWIDRMWQDAAFKTAARARWAQIIALFDFSAWLDDVADAQREAKTSDDLRWEAVTYLPQQVDRRKVWLERRIDWITTAINA